MLAYSMIATSLFENFLPFIYELRIMDGIFFNSNLRLKISVDLLIFNLFTVGV